MIKLFLIVAAFIKTTLSKLVVVPVAGTLLADLQKAMYSSWGNNQNALCDPNIQASPAGAFAPTYPITRVSGTNAITSLTVPYNGFSGRITFLPTGVFTWTVAGNIALAGSAVVGKALDFVYDPNAAKWYPSYIA